MKKMKKIRIMSIIALTLTVVVMAINIYLNESHKREIRALLDKTSILEKNLKIAEDSISFLKQEAIEKSVIQKVVAFSDLVLLENHPTKGAEIIADRLNFDIFGNGENKYLKNLVTQREDVSKEHKIPIRIIRYYYQNQLKSIKNREKTGLAPKEREFHLNNHSVPVQSQVWDKRSIMGYEKAFFELR